MIQMPNTTLDYNSKAKYDQLIRAGKPKKIALTAIMRKLIVIAMSLTRDMSGLCNM